MLVKRASVVVNTLKSDESISGEISTKLSVGHENEIYKLTKFSNAQSSRKKPTPSQSLLFSWALNFAKYFILRLP